jgi:hypothetical protein
VLKPFSMIFFIAVMVWIGSIFVTSDPQTRIERACVPATFADKVLVAVVQVIHEPYAMGAHEMMLAVEYGCRFTVWKTFYEERDGANMSRRKHVGDIERHDKTRQKEQNQHSGSAQQGSDMTEVRIPGLPTPNYLEDK